MNFSSQQNSTSPNQETPFPGISPAFLQRAQIRHVSKDEAMHLLQIDDSGWLFPYFNYDGSPVIEAGRAFYRLRLDHPNRDQKYHQQCGTSPRGYLPPPTIIAPSTSTCLFIVEGEKKALSLAEAGILAVGLGGFYSFTTNQEKLIPELVNSIDVHTPQIILFLGDKDVIFNYQFSHAAITLRELIVQRYPQLCFRVAYIPWSAPDKGVDDCREILGPDQFTNWYHAEVLSKSIPIRNQQPSGLALTILKNEYPTFEASPESCHSEIKDQMIKLAATLQNSPLEQAEIIDILSRFTGNQKGLIKKAINIRSRQLRLQSQSDLPVAENAINVQQAAGSFARDVLSCSAHLTYYFNERLCYYDKGQLVALNEQSVVSFLDVPETLSFCTNDAFGQRKPYRLTEKEGRLIIGALAQNRHLLREVRNVYKAPILVSTEAGAEIVSGYSPQHKIYAGRCEIPEVGVAQAFDKLRQLLADFQFETPGDLARAFSLLITPALLRGNFLAAGRTPFFFIQKDAAGAGGGTLARLVAEINLMTSLTCTPTTPKSAFEDISMHLVKGGDYLCFDNMNGTLLTQLPFLESMLTEPEHVARSLYTHQKINPDRCVFVCTSNGARLSPDLADRSVRLALRKQPPNYRFRNWPEGDLIEHVRKNAAEYLACIYSLICQWVNVERPTGQAITGFRFKQWESICSFFCEQLLGTPLLDDAHQQFQQEVSDPDAVLLRQIFMLLSQRGNSLPQQATDLVEIAASEGWMPRTGDDRKLKMGRMLSRRFPTQGVFRFGQFTVTRRDVIGPDTNYDPIKTYAIDPRTVN